MARQIGYSQEEIDALGHIPDTEPEEGSPPGPFDPALTTALVYAKKMTGDAHHVTDGLFARMRRHWTDTQILEITCVVGLANYWNRFTTALRIDLSGTNEPYDPPAK